MSTPLSTLGKYQLHEELGHGGFATVYRAHDPDLGLDVALKVLSANFMRDPSFVDRFRAEARVTARLKHPNIARVINIDQADGRLFLAVEYVPGRNLRDRLRDQPLLDWPLITSIVQQVGDALDYAHGQGVLHRDVKPNNILVTDDGLAVLTDFGLAKAVEGSGMTTSGVALGTFKYIAPEQANGKEVDARSDLYSLAVVAYELCTGRAPFNSDSTPALIHAQVYDAPPPPSQINARVAAPIEQVLLTGLSKEREARYQSGKELAAALSAAVDKTVGEYADSLHQLAASYEQQGNYDAAEDTLKQVLVIQPNHAEAQALLLKINQQRNWQQRYARLSEQIKTARAEAQELKQANLPLDDREGVLALLTETRLSETRLSQQPRPASRPETELPRASMPGRIALGGLAISAVIAIVISFIILQPGSENTPERTVPYYASVVNNWTTGNFALGLGVGLLVVLAVVLVVQKVERNSH